MDIRKYSQQEIATIIKHYPIGGWQECARHLKYRSRLSIEGKAYRLGIREDRTTRNAAINLLAGGIDPDEVADFLCIPFSAVYPLMQTLEIDEVAA